MGGANMHMCPCADSTNGFTTSGKCIAAFKCQADSSGGMPPMLPMLPMPMPMPSSPSSPSDSPCDQGGQASSIVTGTTTNATSSAAASSTCPSTNNDFGQYPSYDTSSSNTNTDNSGTSGGLPDITSLLNGPATDSGSVNTTPTGGTIVPSTPTSPAATPPAPFGSVEGVTGDVQVQGQYVRVLASNRNSARGTQVSGFYGFQTVSGIAANDIFKNLCALRPWSSNFISFIVPSSYFDALCSARNFAVGVTAAATSNATVSNTTYSGTSANATPSAPSAPRYLGNAHADIWATPSAVSSGDRTSIFWDATGVSACSITSSDHAFSGSSLSGHASTGSLTANTAYTITCQTATSTVSNQVVVVVQ
jgi:hypothetical protein